MELDSPTPLLSVSEARDRWNTKKTGMSLNQVLSEITGKSSENSLYHCQSLSIKEILKRNDRDEEGQESEKQKPPSNQRSALFENLRIFFD